VFQPLNTRKGHEPMNKVKSSLEWNESNYIILLCSRGRTNKKYRI